MSNYRNEPWTPKDATYAIRDMGNHPALSVAYKVHATQRLVQRGLIISDVLRLLKTGFVFSAAIPATKSGYYRYEVVGTTPNSGERQICAVVIPDINNMTMKIVTVFWVDETQTRSGTILEDGA